MGIIAVPPGFSAADRARALAVETNSALKTQVPSLDELFASAYNPNVVNGGGSCKIFTARFPMKITSAVLAADTPATNPPTALVAASDTIYLTWWLRRIRATAAGQTTTNIATKTTRASSGGPIYRFVPWTFDDQVFADADATLQAGDLVDIACAPTGSVATLQGLTATIGYVPL